VSELETEYGEQVDFVVIDAEETKKRGDELERYLLASRSHGLVAFDAAGEVAVTIAGHQFGRDEIVMAIGQITE
jgi:hypothetical protein